MPPDRAGKGFYRIPYKPPHQGEEGEASLPVSTKAAGKTTLMLLDLQKSSSLLEEPRAARILREPGPRSCQGMLQWSCEEATAGDLQVPSATSVQGGGHRL